MRRRARRVRRAAATTTRAIDDIVAAAGRVPRRVLPLLREQGPARPACWRSGPCARCRPTLRRHPRRGRADGAGAHGGPAPLAAPLQRRPGRRGGDDPGLGRRRARGHDAPVRLGAPPSTGAGGGMARFLRPRGFGDVDTEARRDGGAARRVRRPAAAAATVDAAAHIIERGLPRPLSRPSSRGRPTSSNICGHLTRGGQRANSGRRRVERARALHRDRARPSAAARWRCSPGDASGSDAAKEAGAGTLAIECDVTDEASCRSAIEEAAAGLGGIDALVYTPGIGPLSRLVDTDAETWRRVFDTNVTGAALVTSRRAPPPRRLGRRARCTCRRSARR